MSDVLDSVTPFDIEFTTPLMLERGGLLPSYRLRCETYG